MVLYGQVVVGQPGAGKSTLCNGMQQYLRLIGREALVVNLDPANEFQPNHQDQDLDKNKQGQDQERHKQDSEKSHLPYDTILDVSEEIINLSSVMEELGLGPNGGLIYCLEYLAHHTSTLIEILSSKIKEFTESNNGTAPYLLLDLPGQVELYTHNTCVQNILSSLVKEMDLRLAAIHLVDSHACVDASKFISAALLSTTTMLRLELPAVNVLSKIDLLAGYGNGSGSDSGSGPIPFNLDYFIECFELDRLLPFLEGMGDLNKVDDEVEMRIMEDEEYRKARMKTRSTRFHKRYHKMHKELCEVIEDYSLLSYVPLDINDAASMGRLVARIDKCNGYVFTGKQRSAVRNTENKNGNVNSNLEDMFQCAIQADSEWGYEQIADVQERYMGSFQEDVPELKRK